MDAMIQEVLCDMNYKGWIQFLIFQKSLGSCMTLDKLNHLYGPRGKMRKLETMTYNVLFFSEILLNFPAFRGLIFFFGKGEVGPWNNH